MHGIHSDNCCFVYWFPLRITGRLSETMAVIVLFLTALFAASEANAEKCVGQTVPNKHVLCYVADVTAEFDDCHCTHTILPAAIDSDTQQLTFTDGNYGPE